MDERDGPDGQTLYVDRNQRERGSNAPFFVTFTDLSGESRWGYFCGSCETFDNAMDAMGRIKCNVCGNVRKPEEWDAAHE